MTEAEKLVICGTCSTLLCVHTEKSLDNMLQALKRIAHYDLTKERSGVNVAVLQGIARDVLYGE